MTHKDDSLTQEKNKLVAKHLEVIKNPIDQLDIILTVIDDDIWKPHKFYDIKNYLQKKYFTMSDKNLSLALEKLCEDKYVALVSNDEYRITYQGRIFLSKVPKINLGRPYRNQNSVEIRKNNFTLAKTVLNVFSTLIIIIIGAMGVYVADKSNKLEASIDEMKQINMAKVLKIDSLIKLTQDTAKFKPK